jgi:cytochrome c-type biogenesis protein CcmH/NrfG
MMMGSKSGFSAISCIAYDPYDSRAWLGLARIQWKKGQTPLAEKAYKDGLYHNPKNPYLLQSYADMLIKLGEYNL